MGEVTFMWDKLRQEDKVKYKTLITNFASLSEAFSQKAEVEDENAMNYVAPIVNSKFQETVFQKAFHAIGEDIANTSYDASVVVDEKHKYLVGIKSFGIHSGDQKVAQFKKDSQNWTELLNQIKFHAAISPDKETANEVNRERYQTLALKIAQLRNQRIESSKAQIRGFNSDDVFVESVYHVLMPTPKGREPQIFVGETTYLPIDIENLKVLGATNINNPTNFRFTDGQHTYKYTAADSQLHMTFNNKDIVVDTWDVQYIDDPFYVFEHLHILTREKENNVEQTVSWMIANKENKVEESSGFNGFNGGSKLSRKGGYREKRIEQIVVDYHEQLEKEQLELVERYLTELLIPKYRTDEETQRMRTIRQEFMSQLAHLGNMALLSDVEKLIYRDAKEVYIPIPDSKSFHNSFPDFFGKGIGTFKETDKRKLALKKEERTFTLKFLASGDEIEAYINQENGKAIQSTKKQAILGEWLLKGVFQLQEREPLTYEKLVDLNINAIRLTKFNNSDVIGIEFIWIDSENPPKDAIGWVAKK